MAAKRLHDDSDQDRQPSSAADKRLRRLPSFSTVIREAMMAKSLQNIFVALEPLLRQVVREEVETGVIHSMRSFQRSAPIQIEAAAAEAAGEPSSGLKLIFTNQLSLPIFTGSKIEGAECRPLQLAVVDVFSGELVPASSLPSPLKIELLVLDGDFPSGDKEEWSAAEFQSNIVKERTGKRPLLTGDVSITLRDGTVSISDLSFTDNSSWIRSRHFRIGARVVPGTHDGARIKEAMTEPFTVKDHRGELYRKHYPPALGDEVWRLERIGKDGAFHRKLSAEKIRTVQDFLKLLVVDPLLLRSILGVGMSDRVWEATIAHAKTCNVGEKLYLFHGSHFTLLLNPVCQVVGIMNGTMTTLSLEDLNKAQRVQVEHLVREAYQNWDKLEETSELLDHNNILTQGLQMPQSGAEALTLYPPHPAINAIDFQLEDFGNLDPASLL